LGALPSPEAILTSRQRRPATSSSLRRERPVSAQSERFVAVAVHVNDNDNDHVNVNENALSYLDGAALASQIQRQSRSKTSCVYTSRCRLVMARFISRFAEAK